MSCSRHCEPMLREAPHPEVPNRLAREKFHNRTRGCYTPLCQSDLMLVQPPRKLMSPLTIDPALLDPAAIPAETRKLNQEIVARLEAEPVGLTIPEIRARRLQGLGAFPLAPKSPRAEMISIDGPGGKACAARHRAERAARHILPYPR